MKPARNTLLQQDCLQAFAHVPEGSVDLVFADPPFNIGYDYDVYHDRRDADDYQSWSEDWMRQVYRALKPDGTFWLAIGDEYAAELKVLARQIGFHCRSWVIWYYTFGVNCQRKFSRSHAHLFHFVKDAESFTFNDHEIRVPSARQLVYGDRRANPRGRLPDDTWILRPQDCDPGFEADEDTWYFPRVAGTFKERAGFHGCQMPEQLLGRIIRCCSNPGELVLDPFAGSSTTLVVARKLGRDYLGFEISEEYVRRGVQRLGEVQPGDELEGAPEPRVSAPATPQNPDGKRASQARSATRNARPRKTLDLVECVTQAFDHVHDGYSVDRVVADPELNRLFLETCRAWGQDRAASELNQQLFRLRKSGRLAHINSQRRSPLVWSDFDQFMDGTEIALAQLTTELDATLDQLLCDPEQAASLDRIAGELAPGFSSFQYRWGALKLRKEARAARRRSQSLELPELAAAVPLAELGCVQTPESAGVYVVADSVGEPMYAGVTLNLRQRLERLQLLARKPPASAPQCDEWRVAIGVLSSSDDESEGSAKAGSPRAVGRLLAQQCQLVTQFAPRWNYGAFSLV